MPLARFARPFVSAAIVVVLLVGCLGNDESTPAPTMVEAVTPPPASASASPSNLPSPAATPAAQASAAPSPTARATVAPTAAVTATAQPPTTGSMENLSVALQPVATGLAQPLYVTHAGDGSGNLYVVEKGGSIRIVSNGAVRPQAFLNITDRVGSRGSEQGLLGLAFHPDYTSNGFFYVDYTDVNGDTRIERYTASGDRSVADPASAKLILAVDQPYANHNGGQILFGPDGMLWIGLGDGGSGGDPQRNGQNTGALLGKILRIDVDSGDPYGVPPDNPFVNEPGARPEIWAYGLRNPWRFSFDRATGDLYIGDVGQNSWEEVDYLPAGSDPGANLGWNRMEGTHCFPAGSSCDESGLILPITEYQTSREGCAVTGGYVYRGSQFPAMSGIYFFTDYCSGTLWALTRAQGNGGDWERTELIPAPASYAGYSSFGQDEAGELYVTGLSDGTIYHLVAR